MGRRPFPDIERGRQGGRIAALLFFAPLSATLLSLAACGPVPHPFAPDRVAPLVSDQKALAPLAVRGIDGAPGLAEALVQALGQEDIAASLDNGGDGFMVLSGTIRSRDGIVQIIWRITDGNGRTISEFRQPLPASAADLAHRADFVQSTTRTVVGSLRGEDSGARDIDAAPRVVVRTVSTPAEYDGDALARAMARALGPEGLIAADAPNAFIVSGTLKVGPTIGGQNLVGIDWTVSNAAGHPLGTVSQGSPVPHEQLTGPLGGLFHDIAEAGAPGIAEVIRKHPPAAPPAP